MRGSGRLSTLPLRGEFEHYSTTVAWLPSTCQAHEAAIISRAIEVACGVQQKRSAWHRPVRWRSLKVIQHRFGAGRVQFEHHSAFHQSSVARQSAVRGCAEEVAAGVADEAGIRGRAL